MTADLEKHLLNLVVEGTTEENKLKAELSVAHGKVVDAMQGLALIWWGVKPGVLVVDEKDRVWRVHSVRVGDNPGWLKKERPWLQAFMRKKDGTYMTDSRQLYREWKVLTGERLKDTETADRLISKGAM